MGSWCDATQITDRSYSNAENVSQKNGQIEKTEEITDDTWRLLPEIQFLRCPFVDMIALCSMFPRL